MEVKFVNDDSISTLLFTNHPSEQFGIPMNSVARIERITIDQIDSIAGQELLQYRGATLPLISLERCISAREREEQTRLFVVVFRAGDREVGLIAPSIQDITTIPSQLDVSTFSDPGLLGAIVINGRTTRILDAYELAKQQYPDWFAKAVTVSAEAVHGDAAAPSSSSPPKILLAEDSSFFRAKVKQYLEQLGTTVVAAEDGAEAWSILQSGNHEFDIVVTDIEMPNMNGFELCEHIRAAPAFSQLPVVALTSLASDEHQERGRQAGVDEYLIKLDRDKLVLTVTAILTSKQSASQTLASACV